MTKSMKKNPMTVLIHFLFQVGVNVMFTGESLHLSRMLKECDLFFFILVEVHFPSWQYVQQFILVRLGGKKKKRVEVFHCFEVVLRIKGETWETYFDATFFIW